MKKKYIIALEDRNVWSCGVPAKTLLLSDVSIFGTDLSSVNTGIELTPYTEPDLEQVRKEAYDKCRGDVEMLAHKLYSPKIDGAYQRGLNDAWECVRKISSMDSKTRDEIFDRVITSNIVDENTASEAIEKIRQYEQKKEEQIQVGDEVKLKCGVGPAIYMQGSNGSDEIYLLFNDGSCGFHRRSEIECKTGRHFPEIAEVLQKMKEEE